MPKNSCIFIVSDLHVPYQHPSAFEFINEIVCKFKPDLVLLTGDEVDNASISFHDKDPDLLFSPSSELETAISEMKELYTIIPKAKVLESNHGSLVYRKGRHHGLPRTVFKNWNEILEAPKGWSWHFDLTVKMSNGEMLYGHHGLSTDCLKPSQRYSMNYFQGHYHTKFEIRWWANPLKEYFAMTCGCLVDRDSMAFAYSRNNLPEFMLGGALIIDGVPHLIPMKLNKKGLWDRKIRL